MDLAKRYKSRRQELGLTQREISELIGITQPALHKIENGLTTNPRKILKIAEALKCEPDWLLFGNRKSEPSLTVPFNKLQGQYPVLDWVQAGNFSAIGEINPSEAEHYPCPVKCSDSTFLLKVRGQSMAGTFNEGELIFVDPTVQPINGKYVVARLEDDNEATLKQLIIEGNERYLKATNPDWPNKILPVNGNCTIVGVVIFAGRLF